jgi:holo-[acyl-carrier protein] synthase
MIYGIGNDIIEVKRIELAIERHGQRFLDKLFTRNEQDYCFKHADASRHFAGRFAAKEALVKAFGTGISKEISWLDMEIINDMNGKPFVIFTDSFKASSGISKVLISISHCREYATAFAIIEQ